MQNEKDLKILKIKISHGREFENWSFETFCEKHTIPRGFSCPRMPQ